MIKHKKLLDICHYDQNTGFFVWKNNPAPNHAWRNGLRMGRISTQGYVHIKIENQYYAGARLAWFYMMGKWPEKDIDHINRIRHDNRWSNLREATESQSVANSIPAHPSLSKYRGVVKIGSGWRADVKRNNKTFFSKTFSGKEAAAIARDIAAKEAYGEFAILNFPTASSHDWILI